MQVFHQKINLARSGFESRSQGKKETPRSGRLPTASLPPLGGVLVRCRVLDAKTLRQFLTIKIDSVAEMDVEAWGYFFKIYNFVKSEFQNTTGRSCTSLVRGCLLPDQVTGIALYVPNNAPGSLILESQARSNRYLYSSQTSFKHWLGFVPE